MITGDPLPVDKGEGDGVTGGTINSNGSFLMTAVKVGGETLLARIINMVNEASRSKAPIQKTADKISGIFVPAVVAIAVITMIVWGINGSWDLGFVYAIAVLIIACPCALGLATPVSIMVGTGRAAQTGILIKNARALEQMRKVTAVMVDKTGTLTKLFAQCQILNLLSTSSLIYGSFTGEKSQKQANSKYIAKASHRRKTCSPYV